MVRTHRLYRGEKDWRFCLDTRRVNEALVKDVEKFGERDPPLVFSTNISSLSQFSSDLLEKHFYWGFMERDEAFPFDKPERLWEECLNIDSY